MSSKNDTKNKFTTHEIIQLGLVGVFPIVAITFIIVLTASIVILSKTNLGASTTNTIRANTGISQSTTQHINSTPAKEVDIVPHLHPSGPNAPTYTTVDAIAFANKVPPFDTKTLSSTRTAIKAYFETDAQAKKEFSEDPGLAPNAPICVVIVQGRFIIGGAPQGAKQKIVDQVYEIYDGRSGLFIAITTVASAVEKP